MKYLKKKSITEAIAISLTNGALSLSIWDEKVIYEYKYGSSVKAAKNRRPSVHCNISFFSIIDLSTYEYV